MKIVSLSDSISGAIAARPVYDENMTLLVNAGSRLEKNGIDRLLSRGFKYIYIHEEGTETIEIPEPVSVDNSRKVVYEVRNTFQSVRSISSGEKTTLNAVMKNMSNDHRFKNLVPKGSFRQNVMKLVSELYDRNTSTVNSYSLSMLGANPLSHAMDVTMLTVLLGKRFNYSLKELISIATASLLHDAGLQIFPDIVEKPLSLLTNDEKEQYRKHPRLSFELLDCLGCFQPVETFAVLHHHENQDGSGFPQGLKGSNDKPLKTRHTEKGLMFRWAEIIAVADRYVHYSAGNLTPIPLPPIESIARVIDDSGTVLNSVIVSELVKIINIFPIGTPVKILESINSELIGYEGVVIEENQGQMEAPVVLLLKTRKGQKILPPLRVNFAQDRGVKLSPSI